MLDTIASLSANTPKDAFRQIAALIAPQLSLKQESLFEALCLFEELDKSGIGGGVAIPQGKLKMLKEPVRLFVKLNRAVDFEAIDHKPVDLIFVILSPDTDGPLHLRRLSEMSRLARDKQFCNRLRGCTDEETMQAVIFEQQNELRRAA